MTLRPTLRRLSATTLLALAGAHAHGAIVEGADVGMFRTFVDTTTGTVWADLDNHLMFTGTGFQYRFADRSAYLAALQAAGFVWAFTSEVAALTAAVPMATTQDYDALGTVMGSLSFGETTSLDGYANATDGLVTRHFGSPNWSAGSASWGTPTFGPWVNSLNDSGLWAYLAAPAGSAVPVPGTLALAGLGLFAIAGRRRAR